MRNYTNEERFDALNRHRETLYIDGENGFTVLTQHVKYKNIEDFCDMILHHENFHKEYNEVDYYYQNTELYRKRKKIFFNENRKLTDEETEVCVKIDEERQIALKKLHDLDRKK